MSSPRQFFVKDAPDTIAAGNEIALSERDSHHLTNVLRLQENTSLRLVVPSCNSVCEGTLISPDKKQSLVRIATVLPIPVHTPAVSSILVSLCKAKKNEFVIEKATELGVEHILFANTQHSEFKFHSSSDRAKKTDRWELIAESAANQSGRYSIPAIEIHPSLADALTSSSLSVTRLVCSLEPDARTFEELPVIDRSATISIGPEGDFSPQEYEQLKSAGFIPFSLGSEILRAETAVIAGLATIRAISKA